MPVKVMTTVWELSLQSDLKFVLLALADIANDQGGNLFPSIRHIAGKVSKSERQTQRSMKELIDMGMVKVIGNEHGGKQGTTRHYSICLEALARHNTNGGDIMTPVSPMTLTHDVGVTQTVNNHEYISLKNKQKEKQTEQALPEFLPKKSWQEFIEHRRQMKKPMTSLAIEKLLKRLGEYHQQGYDVVAMIDTAIERQWLTLYPPHTPPENTHGRAYDSHVEQSNHPDDAIFSGAEPKPPQVPMTEERRKRIEQEKCLG